MTVRLTPAPATLAAEYIRLRGLTRENPIPEARLAALGITATSWAAGIAAGELVGAAALEGERLVGHCFGEARTGEVLVLAVLPGWEGQGVGRRLLDAVVARLRGLGHERIFLACSTDPGVRSHGFYRHLGWRGTGQLDGHGDEVLEWSHPRSAPGPRRPVDPPGNPR